MADDIKPSPPEQKGFWNRSTASTTSSNQRSLFNENEPFSISRESFDSYRRSFVRCPCNNFPIDMIMGFCLISFIQDISARSSVPQVDPRSLRQSFDSGRQRLPRSSFGDRHLDRELPTAEEGFEDVGLNDDIKPK